MGIDDLQGTYRRLRAELDAAYSADLWDTAAINSIVDRMVRIEQALSGMGNSVAIAANPNT